MKENVLVRSDCPLHYWVHGDATRPLIVFTHGAGCDNKMFGHQVAALYKQYCVLTWDVRGHGLSRRQAIGTDFTMQLAADDLLAILDAEKAKQVILAGQSMGGNISQMLTRQHQDRVAALVLIDCACNTHPLNAVEKFGLWITPAMLRLYPYETLLKQSAKVAALTPSVQDYVYAAMRTMSKADVGRVMTETLRCLTDEPEHRFNKPMLLVRGDHSNAGSIKTQMPLWAKREPQAHYTVIPNAGHTCNMDNPTEVNRVLQTFLSGLSIT